MNGTMNIYQEVVTNREIHIHISRHDKFLYGRNDFIKNLYSNLMLLVFKISLRTQIGNMYVYLNCTMSNTQLSNIFTYITINVD